MGTILFALYLGFMLFAATYAAMFLSSVIEAITGMENEKSNLLASVIIPISLVTISYILTVIT